MKFLVLGADGMVGSGVVNVLRRAHTVIGTTRERCAVENVASFQMAIDESMPDVIVNCIGVIPQRTNDAVLTISANALFPHQLRELWGGKLIHISTDCALDQNVYGRSKLLGEVGMTLRCCVVGFSPKTKVSFLDWFVFNSPPAVDGWRRAYFSPVTNLELGSAVEAAAERYAEGVFHVSGERMSKHDYLGLANAEFALGKTIRPVDEPQIDKSSACERFGELTGWRARPASAQIAELRQSV